MFLDSHFHTNVYTRYEGALEQALAVLTEHKIFVLSSSTDPDSYQTTLEIAEKSPYVIPCFGIHPQVAHDYLEKIDSLQDQFNTAIAYGEIGLDHYFLQDKSQYPAQYKMLEIFFKYAKDLNKLVVLHLDGAEQKGLELIKKYDLQKVIIHGYKGSLETLKDLLSIGCYFSVGGNMIMEFFKPAMTEDDWKQFMSIVKAIPKERLLIETDGPCRTELNPPPDAPRSMPTYLFDIMKQITAIRNETVDELQNQIQKNFLNLIKDDKQIRAYLLKILK